jgi:FkbM family methyltransferase
LALKIVRGIHLPDAEEHLVPFVKTGPLVHGKGTYQLHKYLAALKLVRKHRHAVDVGAHVGLWARIMAHDFAHVTMFEPHPVQVECLAANMADLTNWTHHGVALGEGDGVVMMEQPDGNSGNTHVGSKGVPVKVRAIDSYGLDDVDFLKIDVEGFEFDVLQGASETIQRCRPVVVIEQKANNAERYGRGRWDASNLLKSWGMKDAAVLSGDHIMIW